MMKQLKSFNFTDAQRKRLASIILKLDKEKQDILVSGDNIATINGQSLLNGGNISLIKTGIFSIVTELPINDIDKDKVYLVPSTETDDENKFSEYIYTDNGWEKLGTFTAKIDLSNYVQKTDVVTDTTNGLMLASDKAKLDAFEEAEQYAKATNISDSVISNIEQVSTYHDENIIFKCTKNNLIDGSSSEFNMIVPAATSWSAGVIQAKHYNKINGVPAWSIASDSDVDIRVEYEQNRIDIEYPVHFISSYGGSNDTTKWFNLEQATHKLGGIMSTDDKVKLDSLVNYKAGNGIDITGDTIRCTLDTSLYSIVTELPQTGLPNKIYLLPSTKTEESNSYTEYGYVDNKWEELGKYKADVDLSPYSKALHLPPYVLGLESTSMETLTSHGNDNVTIAVKVCNLIEGFKYDDSITIKQATNHSAGVMSYSDKVKLDGIEAGAQVNTIESISVNGTPLEVTNKGVNIPNATTEQDGMMSKADKTKLDSLENYTLPAATTTTLGGVRIETHDYSGLAPNIIHILNDGGIYATVKLYYDQGTKRIMLYDWHSSGDGALGYIDCAVVIKDGPKASITENGLMSAVDKSKLDSQPTIKASDATGVTDDDYVVIKKSELDSILSRLSALENKA